MPCKFCEDVTVEYHTGHAECSAEFKRRYDNDECLWCGKHPVDGVGGTHECKECKAMNDPSYRGYPGPGGS